MAKFAMTLAAAALVACSSPQDMSETVGVASPESEDSPVAFAKPSVVLVDNEQMKFSFSWPAQAVSIPELNAVFEARAKAEEEKFSAMTTEAQADAKEYGYPYRAYDFSKGWEVAASTPRFISLAAGTYAYTGGAHGNSWFDSMIWDRAAGAVMAQTDLFASPAALEAAVREAYCTGLKAERSERLGANMLNGTDVFDSCPALEELVAVLESSTGEAFDTINLMAAPYVAGSYAEGPYEVKIPVTQAVIDAAKSEYRDAFSLGS
ncbi:MAG: DUF4163 domain-containing protein [Pseudomonadota bacterium]